MYLGGMKSMDNKKINISKNLVYLRKMNHFSIEEVANKIGVSRQAVSKWEAGETIPDLINCDMLAEMYNVSVDELIHFNADKDVAIAPKDKHIFGTTVIGTRGQVVIPKSARDMLEMQVGDMLIVLGDTNPDTKGIALVPADAFLKVAKDTLENFYPKP